MKPIIICLTPVRNEAWCLDVFLQCTSLWADHIIIADQNSTDGSREIAIKYSKVTLIEYNSNFYCENERQKLLINESRKIEGDKILVALDADEVFTANFINTNDWHRILHSKPGEVFGIQWANIWYDKEHYFSSKFYFPWVFHDDGITEHKKYVKWIHSMRIPFPENADSGYFKITEFKVLHFAWLDKNRFNSKNRYYQCLVCLNDSKEHFISLFRSYHLKNEKRKSIPQEWLQNYKNQKLDILQKLNISISKYWYDNEVIDFFDKYGFPRFKYLDIWDKYWIEAMKDQIDIDDPRNSFIQLIHFYLRASQKISNSFPIKVIDKILKKLL
jgi:hypothetical protein